MFFGGSRGLMDRALDLKPEVTQGCEFESRLWQEVSTTEVRPLSKAPNPQLSRCTGVPGTRRRGTAVKHFIGHRTQIAGDRYTLRE